MERTMQECSRVSGAFDFAYPASNGGIKDYGSRSSEVRCQKTDLEIRWLSGVETNRIDATVTNRKERKEIECRIPTVSAPLDLRLEGFPFDEIRWLRGSHSPDGNRDRNESSRIKRMDCGMSLQVELFLLQDSWNNHSSNGLPIHGVFTN
jgi:hypothetical protein